MQDNDAGVSASGTMLGEERKDDDTIVSRLAWLA